MKNASLKKLIEEYDPSSQEEKHCKQRFLAFIDRHKNCFSRFLEEGHITASCWLVDKGMKKALLTHHAKLHRWLQLGGHCEEEDQDVLASAIREAREESGIDLIEPVERGIFDLDIHLIPAKGSESAHFHYDVRFLLRAVIEEDRFSKSHESNELRWIGMDESEAPEMDASVLRLFRKWKSYLEQKV